MSGKTFMEARSLSEGGRRDSDCCSGSTTIEKCYTVEYKAQSQMRNKEWNDIAAGVMHTKWSTGGKAIAQIRIRLKVAFGPNRQTN